MKKKLLKSTETKGTDFDKLRHCLMISEAFLKKIRPFQAETGIIVHQNSVKSPTIYDENIHISIMSKQQTPFTLRSL